MKISKSYKLSEFLDWTRRKLYLVLVLAITPVALYQLLGLKWIALPWSVAVLLGTATSFIVGFKNAQTYNRTVEAQQVWTAIASATRYWAMISRDLPTKPRSTRTLIHRHLAWLTVLRYELRGHRAWESVASGSNAEYRDRFYAVPETESPLEAELAKYLSKDELEQLAATSNNEAGQLISAQSLTIRDLFTSQQLAVGESTENPFEGGANDVPISQTSRLLEIELREMLGETDLPLPLRAQNDIVL